MNDTDPIETETEAAAAYYEEQVRQVRAYCLDTIEWTMAAVPIEKVDEDDPRVPALNSNAGKYFMAKRLLQLLDEGY